MADRPATETADLSDRDGTGKVVARAHAGWVGLAQRVQRLVWTASGDQNDDRPEESLPQAPLGGWTALTETAASRIEYQHRWPTARRLTDAARGLIIRCRAACRRVADRDGRAQLLAAVGEAWRHALHTFHLPAMTGHAAPHRTPPLPDPDPLARTGHSAVDLDPDQIRIRVEAIFALLPPKGDPTLPANLPALGRLLADHPPTVDFEASDLLYDCFSRGTRHSPSRALMAVARNLTRAFGQAGRLPMASAKAWTMLDPVLFADELAAQLAAISNFVLRWQAEEKTFLILEFGEVELIEYLFENLHPRRHAPLLIKVMNFKVLSLRRMGLLRRIPARLRRHLHQNFAADPAAARAYVHDTLALLEVMARPENFPPVIDAARIVRAEVEKIAAQLSAATPQPAMLAAPQTGADKPAAATTTPSLDQIMRSLGGPPPVAMPAAIEPPPPRPAAPPPRRRFTKKQKTEAVMRVLHGEEREWVAISMGITPELLSRWQNTFLDGGAAALAPPKGKDREPSIDELKDKLHALIETVQVLSTQISGSGSPPNLALPAAGRKGNRKGDKPPLALPPPPGDGN